MFLSSHVILANKLYAKLLQIISNHCQTSEDHFGKSFCHCLLAMSDCLEMHYFLWEPFFGYWEHVARSSLAEKHADSNVGVPPHDYASRLRVFGSRFQIFA